MQALQNGGAYVVSLPLHGTSLCQSPSTQHSVTDTDGNSVMRDSRTFIAPGVLTVEIR